MTAAGEGLFKQTKATAKAKEITDQSQNVKRICDKDQRKFSL